MHKIQYMCAIIIKLNKTFKSSIMKRIFILLFFFTTSLFSFAQETNIKDEKVITFSGYISNQMIFDTYDSFDSREGLIHLFPKPANTVNGKDINAFPQFEMLTLSTRLRTNISGPDAFGAKTSSLVEIDFLGTLEEYVRLPRIRHALIKLDWGTANLIMGQYWHPLFVNECFPKVIGFAAGAPFQPINRSPQARLTLLPSEVLQISGTLWTQGYHASKGGAGIQRNSGLPAGHVQLKVTSGNIFIGGTAGYRFYKPRLETDLGVKTEQRLGSYDVQGFFKINANDLTVSLEGTYGQNLTNYVMLGGFGAADDPAVVDDFAYQNLNTLSVWLDVNYKVDALGLGFFGGYTANTGASDIYHSLGIGRGETVDYLYRISPRATYTSGAVQFAFEYMGTAAIYATAFDENFTVTSSADPVMNHRFLLEAKYTF